MLRRPLAILGVGVVGLAASALPALGAQGHASAALPPVKHVFVIVLENEDESTTFGPGSPAPYLAATMPSQGALISNYYGIGHHSLDNYIAMISGQAPDSQTQADCGTFSDFVATGSVDSNGQLPGNGCVYPASVPTLASQLDSAGLTWRGYMDGMGADPSRESATCGHPAVGAVDKTEGATAADQYATRHDPFVYFHKIIDSQSYCDSHVVELTHLQADLSDIGTTPNFSFITPSLCNDGHDAPCANGKPGGLTQANTFLSTVVPEIESSPAFKKDGMLVVTFDEAEGDDSTACCNEQAGPNAASPGGNGPGGGKVGAVVVSPFVAPGTTTSTAYNHYSLLRTIEDIFGLSHLGYAGQSGLATFGSDIFTAASSTTSTSAQTTTTAKTGPPACHAASSGAVLSSAVVTKSGKTEKLTATARRNGELGYQIHPNGARAQKAKTHKLVGCSRLTLSLPSGHGTIALTATAGTRRDTRNVKY